MSADNPDELIFGRRVRMAREALGMLRRQLAAAAGIAEATLKSIETCRRVPGFLSAYKVVAAIAKHDQSKAMWICEARDAGAEIKRAVRAAGWTPLPPLVAEIRATRCGQRVCIGLDVDRGALTKIVEHVRQRCADPGGPDDPLWAFIIAVDDTDPVS